MIRLLTPPFDQTPHDPGYIKGYVPGIRENGGQYTHGAMWVVRAMAELGWRERAAPLLERLTPVWHARDDGAVAIYQVEPYVVAADVYGAPPHVGRGGWTWYTGSSGWMLRVLRRVDPRPHPRGRHAPAPAALRARRLARVPGALARGGHRGAEPGRLLRGGGRVSRRRCSGAPRGGRGAHRAPPARRAPARGRRARPLAAPSGLREHREVLRGSLLALFTLALAAGAFSAGPDPARAPDWGALADVDVPELVTRDADGAERVTKLWIVVVDGQGFVRTGATRWAGNIARAPEVELRALGEAYPLRAVAVADVPLRERVNAAYRAKYGFEDRLLGLFGDASDVKIFRLEPRGAAGPVAPSQPALTKEDP